MSVAGVWLRSARLRYAALACVALAGSWAAYDITSGPPEMTVARYLAGSPDRALAPAGYSIGGASVACSTAGVVLDPKLSDLASAYAGFVILNPSRMQPLPKTVNLYAFAHECGHVLGGPSEERADCYAMARGEAQGWLDAAGVEAICDFWKPYAGDSEHLPGAARCELMQRCFDRARKSHSGG